MGLEHGVQATDYIPSLSNASSYIYAYDVVKDSDNVYIVVISCSVCIS